MSIIPYNKQHIDNKDKSLVLKALDAEKITTGRFCDEFEKKIRIYLESKFVLCVNSGTSGLYLAIKSLKLKKNGIVIMPAINFIASYNSVIANGLRIFLADVDPFTGQIRAEDIINVIKKYKLKKVDLVINMYLGGQACNVEKIYKLKKKYNFYLIEDACHALGAHYKFKKKKYKVGSCKHSDISVFSLHPVKTITSGEGGIISTNNYKFYNNILLNRSHGIKRNPNNHWDYDVRENGHNFRISDIASALGLSQLKKINLFVMNRRKLVNDYFKKIKNLNNYCQIVNQDKINLGAWHLLLLKFNFNSIKKKNKIIQFFFKNKIFLQTHYIPIYKFSIFKKNSKIKKNYNFPGSEKYFKNTISFPLYYKMNKTDLNYVVQTLKKFLKINK